MKRSLRKSLSSGLIGVVVGFSVIFAYQLGAEAHPEFQVWILWFFTIFIVATVHTFKDEINGDNR